MKKIFEATSEWLEIINQNEEIEFDDEWNEDALKYAEINLSDEESWGGRVTYIDSRHTLLRKGDYICCQGFNSPIVFIRE